MPAPSEVLTPLWGVGRILLQTMNWPSIFYVQTGIWEHAIPGNAANEQIRLLCELSNLSHQCVKTTNPSDPGSGCEGSVGAWIGEGGRLCTPQTGEYKKVKHFLSVESVEKRIGKKKN